MGDRDVANFTHHRAARFKTATMSRFNTTLHLPPQDFRFSLYSDWSLSPHLGQVTLEPPVSRLDKRITGRPTHRALYSICRWASPKLHPFIRRRYFRPWPLPFR